MPDRPASPAIVNRLIGFTAVGLLVFIAAVLGFLGLAFSGTIHRPLPVVPQFPEPQVTANERVERIQLEAGQRARIAAKYGGVPIGEAMRMVAARGPHAYDPVTGPKP
jgi:hypothetical protein